MLDPDQQQRLRSLFAEVVEQPEAERAAFVARECADDPAMRRELESMLDVHLAGDSRFLETPLLDSGADRSTPMPLPSINGFEQIEPIAEGGMGTVFKAQQIHPVRRTVALKVIKKGMDSDAVLRRFEAERQAMALMSHPYIATVHDAGTDSEGRPFIAMEFVPGRPITEFCEAEQLALEARLELVVKVCHAVEHAHRRGVLHRDLKPSNVLVHRSADAIAPKIIDFGIAKAMQGPLGEQSIHTESGTFLGTPEYMSPEQVDGNASQIDTRSDVYSLGVMLYELLTAELPFSSEKLRQASFSELSRIVHEEVPPKPSTRLRSGAAESPDKKADTTRWQRRLAGDLDWIAMKALEKAPDRRYGTPRELALDLENFLQHRPVSAGPPSGAYRLRKFVRRYRVQVAAAALVLVALVVGLFGTLWFLFKANTLATERGTLAANLTAKVAEYRLLSGVVRHEQALAAERRLYPAWPEHVQAMQRWQREQCQPLLDMRPEIRDTISNLELELSSKASERPNMEPLAIGAQRFLLDVLVDLLANVDELEKSRLVALQRRLAWAERIAELSRAHPNARVTWDAVREQLRTNPKYRGQTIDFDDDDILGLVPLGINPKTGYLEFYHLRSAWNGLSDPASLTIPNHRADGSIEVTGTTGIVFVLLPGGRTTLGSQKEDAHAPFYDPQRHDDETLHEVTLASFLLARHELTQGQWARMWDRDSAGRDPSSYKVARRVGPHIEVANPVEQVDWTMCNELLTQHGLTLPTEAQWEYGCRAGTTSPWWPSDEAKDLDGYVNVVDLTGHTVAPQWGDPEPFEDGHHLHAPVGTFGANGFGLFDVHGNVWEWCLDVHGSYGNERPGDGLRPDSGTGLRGSRGGSFFNPAVLGRSADRNDLGPSFRFHDLGVRAARSFGR